MTDHLLGPEGDNCGAELLVTRQGPILVMTLNRPWARNALTSGMTRALHAAIGELANDDGLRVGVLHGAGEGFCAGIDLKAFAASGPPDGLRDLLRKRATKPLVAAVEGFALAGGLELALMCDLVVAARGAKVGLPEARHGLLASGGGLFRLPSALATEMALTGAALPAERLAECGVITRLTDPGTALATATSLAEAVAANAPLSVAAALQLLRARPGRTEDEMWDIQVPLRDMVFGSADAREGATAFSQKRPPQWAGC
jgi:enoyl-CoA hydratase